VGLVKRVAAAPPSCGPIALRPELSAVLGRVHAASTTRRPILDLAAVVAAERALSAIVPDEALAFLAARGLTPAWIVAETDAVCTWGEATFGAGWARDFNHIVLDRVGDWPSFCAAYPRQRDDRKAADLCVWDLKKSVRLTGPGWPRSLIDYVRWRFGPASDDLKVDLDGPHEGPAFEPVIEGQEPSNAGPRRVRHARFGLGTVLEQADDKVVVLFDDGQRRTMLARFVEDA
jgi:hypothetical protein